MPRKKAQPTTENIKGTQQVIPVSTGVSVLNPTADELIQEYFRNDEFITSENKRFAEHMKPFNDRQEAIKAQLQDKMNQEGLDNIKSEHGTAYKSRILNTKIDADAEPYKNADGYLVRGREAVLDFCMDNWAAVGNEMLQVGVTKDAVKAYMEQHGKPPPGISTSTFVRVNIRRS